MTSIIITAAELAMALKSYSYINTCLQFIVFICMRKTDLIN